MVWEGKAISKQITAWFLPPKMDVVGGGGNCNKWCWPPQTMHISHAFEKVKLFPTISPHVLPHGSFPQNTIKPSKRNKTLAKSYKYLQILFGVVGGGVIVISDVDPHKLCILACFWKGKAVPTISPHVLPHGSFPRLQKETKPLENPANICKSFLVWWGGC